MGQAKQRGTYEQRVAEGAVKKEKREALQKELNFLRKELSESTKDPQRKIQEANVKVLMEALKNTPADYI